MRTLPVLLLMLFAGCTESTTDPELTDSGVSSSETMQTDLFSFDAGGNKLVGMLDSPEDQEATATIILVHGYGATNVVEQNWYYNLRTRFAGLGINTLVWDKPGCGQSEGKFDINQPVESSAAEVVAAVRALQDRNVKGSDKIGLWGISRAGWIAPLAMQAEPAIDFWISVSGTDDKENARYLLASNFPIEGRTAEETEQLVGEWQAQFNTGWQDATYQEYLDAAPNLRADPFIALLGWNGVATEAEFLAYKAGYEAGAFVVDEQTELEVYVPDFRQLLASLDKPVLALFGEKDTNVDWRSTARLYRQTIGENPNAALSIQTFPDANHNMRQSKTGGVREMQAQDGNTPYAEGYHEAMLNWLVAEGFGRPSASAAP